MFEQLEFKFEQIELNFEQTLRIFEQLRLKTIFLKRSSRFMLRNT
ncbi:hypothetical protein ACLIA0_03935 [Bacillaceae bacterium W0354]